MPRYVESLAGALQELRERKEKLDAARQELASAEVAYDRALDDVHGYLVHLGRAVRELPSPE